MIEIGSLVPSLELLVVNQLPRERGKAAIRLTEAWWGDGGRGGPSGIRMLLALYRTIW